MIADPVLLESAAGRRPCRNGRTAIADPVPSESQLVVDPALTPISGKTLHYATPHILQEAGARWRPQDRVPGRLRMGNTRLPDSACISTRQDNSNKRARTGDKERRSWRRTLVDDGHGKRRGRVLLLPVSSILRVTTSLAHGEVPGHHFKQACGEQQAARALALHKFLARCLRRARLTILECGSADA